MSNAPTLKPCPHCGAELLIEGPSARHPEADCLYSADWLFPWTVPSSVKLWNQRVHVPE